MRGDVLCLIHKPAITLIAGEQDLQPAYYNSECRMQLPRIDYGGNPYLIRQRGAADAASHTLPRTGLLTSFACSRPDHCHTVFGRFVELK